MGKPKYLLHMHNILVSPWRDCVYVCVLCVFYIYILLYIYRHICTVIHICLYIISDKIFRGNWNVHIFHGPTEHSSYAIFSFFVFFFALSLRGKEKTSEKISFKYSRHKYLSRLG